MLNIELQSVGLVMLIVIFTIFVRQRSLDLSSRRLYFHALVFSMICVSLDILSIVGIYFHHLGEFSQLGEHIICKAYIISLAFQSYQGFLYAAGEFFARNSHRGLRIFYGLWLVMGSIAIAFLPIDTYIEGRVVYSYGLSTTVTYIVTIVYIVSTIVMAFKVNDRVSRRRRTAILLWQGMWLAAALIQLLNPQLLLVGFATCMGMVILYAELENPHESIDRRTGQFTANALGDYMHDRFSRNIPFASLHIRIEQLSEGGDLDTAENIMMRAATFLEECTTAKLFREAGEEFVMIFKDATLMDAEYRRVSDGLAAAIDMPVRIGCILLPNSTILNNAEEFFRVNHHFAAETDTRSTVMVDSNTVEEIRRYSEVRDMILTAMEEHRVEVFYQPFYCVETGKFNSAEALVRIRDRDGTIIPPGVFIPIAEENGLIVPLGIEIFSQVCDFLATGEAQALGLKQVEVNVSVAQFDRNNPSDFVQRIMDEKSISPDQINLEITETASASAKQILLSNMEKLIAYGVHFSLDDFGTGRSNLDYFVQMPVDIIKFDSTFTQAYFTSEKARKVMESSIELMHRLGLKIVSEGVETKEQLDAMCSLGVEYIQGFYFSKPIPKESFINFLKEHQ